MNTCKTNHYESDIFSALVLSSFVSYAQRPGTLDKSFGRYGKTLIYHGRNTYPELRQVFVQKDDKIVAVGLYSSAFRSDPFGFLTVRYTVNGEVDKSYGRGGEKVADNPANDGLNTVYSAIQDDGKIIISGSGYHLNPGPVYDGLVVRLNTDGTTDSSFGQDGHILLNAKGEGACGFVAVQPDGKILVEGLDGRVARTNYLVRLLSNGTVDKTFGDEGYVYFYQYYGFFSCKVDSEGKIVVAGYDYRSGNSNRKFCLQRYLRDGKIDPTFGDSGTVSTPYGDDSFIHDFGFQSDGKIVATGQATSFESGFHSLFATARYNKNGSLDGTFGTDGRVTTSFDLSDCIANSILILSDDKIVVGGTQEDWFNSDFAMIRYTADGSPDSSFGEAGKADKDFTYENGLSSLAMQSTGKIIGAGNIGTNKPPNYVIAVARFNNDISDQPLIAIKGKR